MLRQLFAVFLAQAAQADQEAQEDQAVQASQEAQTTQKAQEPQTTQERSPDSDGARADHNYSSKASVVLWASKLPELQDGLDSEDKDYGLLQTLAQWLIISGPVAHARVSTSV